ncbi:MAG: Uma2 family endonuclease [Bryobacteraceae bacterium]
MSTSPRHSPITVEQYEHFKGFRGLKDELIFGEIVLSPQPKPLHQQIAENIHRSLHTVLQGQPFAVKQNTNIRFRNAHSMPAPDVLVTTREQWMEACDSDSYLSAPPLLIVEVLSPANRRRRVEAKVQLYLANGVKEVWLASPKRKSVEVIRGDQTESRHQHSIEESIALPQPLSGRVLVRPIFALND